MKIDFRLGVLFVALATQVTFAQVLLAADPGKIEVDLAKPGPPIGKNFDGLMTEEINHSYGGGLCSELIQNRTFQDSRVTDGIVLWNTIDLGHLTVCASNALATGTLKAGDTSLTAGRLAMMEVKGDNVLLGTPLTFDKSNVDQFNL